MPDAHPELSLQRLPGMTPPHGPVVVVVLDGIGLGRGDETDAVALARTPVMDRLDETAIVKTTLAAHGTHVGMPTDSDMGNSEVGHNALGAGRIFAQGARLVAEAIASGAIFDSPVWREGIERARQGHTLHLVGLLSDGNVHAHIDHVFAMVRRARTEGVQRLRVHALQDGRDVGSQTALDYIDPLEAVLDEARQAGLDYRIASGGGRQHVTMDRYEANWAIVERGWKAHVLGQGREFPSARQAIETFRAMEPDISDQNLPAWVVTDDHGAPVGTIEDGDVVFLWNFRGDRAIELTRAFEADATFDRFDRQRVPDVYFAGMMQYDGDLGLPARYLVAPPAIDRTMGQYLAAAGRRQLAVSETQKFGHVTYFWNGNRSGYIDEALETYIEVPGDNVECSERPWMKAAEVTDAAIDAMRRECPCFVRLNYPNGDMVGHTGNLEATIISVEATDLSLGRLLAAVRALCGVTLVTADHGNADQMIMIDKKTGQIQRDAQGRPVPMTSHTLNPVPLWIDDPRPEAAEMYALDESVETRRLSNIAATAFALMGYRAPEGYDASLIRGIRDQGSGIRST